MKNINKFIILIFAFTVMFSSVLFAEWEVSIDGDVMFIANYDKKNESALVIAVDTSIADHFWTVQSDASIAGVLFCSDKISKESSLYLNIKIKSNNNTRYHISRRYIEKFYLE